MTNASESNSAASVKQNAYQVIARKYRPARFADVVGQRHVVRTLTNAIKSGRTAHAYLFVGPRGIGKTTLARIFAKALNCAAPVDGEPCCKCSSCISLAEENSLDVIEVDAASRNSTSDMRELAEDVLTRPIGGRFKIYIIDEVHMLSKAAWNVLLKTVEEPPSHVKFIFATTEVHQVLPTIISRCQRFDLMPIASKEISGRLREIAGNENVSISDGAIEAIARAADGGMRDAQSLLDQMIAFFSHGDGSEVSEEQVLSLFGLTDNTELEKIIYAMITNDAAQVVRHISALTRQGKNLETFFDDLVSGIRAAQLAMMLDNAAEILNESDEAVERYRTIGRNARSGVLQILLEVLSPQGRTLHDALNKQVFVESIILKAMREAHAVRIDDVIAKLNQLRSAGELRFIDQVPAKSAVPQAEYTAPPAEKKSPDLNIGGSQEAKEAIQATAEIQPAAEPEPCVNAKNHEVKETPETAETAEAKKAPETQKIAEDVEAAEEKVQVQKAPEAPEKNEISDSDEGGSANQFSDGRLRHSIANSNPAALKEAEKDPQIKPIVTLFDGDVIDIHLP
jgi:DNA polymerase-3 subunit gamma/tau